VVCLGALLTRLQLMWGAEFSSQLARSDFYNRKRLMRNNHRRHRHRHDAANATSQHSSLPSVSYMLLHG
jgi:hypothetical protein